jgi:outer membrane lipoprotein carrier protein
MRLQNKHLVLLLYFWWLPAIVSAAAVDQLSDKLDQITSVTAKFVQTTQDRYGDVVNLSEGRLLVGPEGRFNITTVMPFEQQLISDGEDIYTYDPELEQVIVRALIKDATQVPILVLGNADPDFLSKYEVRLEKDTQDSQEFSLTATENSVFDRLHLVFAQGQPQRIWFQDSLGQTTEIQLSEVNTNDFIPEETFKFMVPDGVDLIDDR